MSKDYTLSEDQVEVLQELMNMAYGSATAVIAEILDAFATLSIPKVKILSTIEFESYLKKIVEKNGESFFCSQGINGEISGESIFLLSRNSVTSLAHHFELDGEVNDTDLKDIALELTNILSSSTVGTLAEEMESTVSFSAPATEIIDDFSLQNHNEIRKYSQVIIIETLIAFNDEEIEGDLIILMKDESISWVQEALDKIIKEMF